MVPRFLLRREWLLTLGAVGFVLAAGAVFYLSSPTTYVVAVAPRDGVESKLLQAYADTFRDQKKEIRFKIESYDDVAQSAQALQSRKADFAVVRPDVLLPANGLTIAILREEASIILAPSAAKITEVADLAKKRLGIVRGHPADPAFIQTVLTHYDLAPPNVTLVPLALEEVEAALRAKRIDAAAIVAAPTGPSATALVRAVEKAADRKITFVPISEAEALIQRFPALISVALPAGTLGGRPKQPAEEAKTAGVTHRLVGAAELDRTKVAKVTQFLFQMRSRVVQATPAANLIKAPETETLTSATLPNHPGAVDYLQREQLTFMDRYGDYLWLALFSMGGISSGFAWLAQRFARKRRELVDVVLDRLMGILTEARECKSVAALDDLALEIDGLVTHAVRYARFRTTDTRTMSALMLAIEGARAAITDRRRDVLDEAAVRDTAVPKPRITAAS